MKTEPFEDVFPIEHRNISIAMLVYQRVSILESTNDHKEIIDSTFQPPRSPAEAWMRQLLRENRPDMHFFQRGWGNELGETF